MICNLPDAYIIPINLDLESSAISISKIRHFEEACHITSNWCMVSKVHNLVARKCRI